MSKMRRAILFSLFDASWWLLGFVIWVATLGSAEAELEETNEYIALLG